MPSLGRPVVIPDVVEEHFDELDWLWEHREANVYTTDWTLADLAEHEERAEAHLDGLRLSELHGIDLAVERITGDEPFASTAATLVLFDAGEPEFREQIWLALREAPPEAVDGIRVGLRHRSVDEALPTLRDLVHHDDGFRAAAAVDVLAFHRLEIEGLDRLLDEAEAAPRALAIGAAGRLGALSETALAKALAHEASQVRWAALLAAARSGMPKLLDRCRQWAGEPGVVQPEAIATLGIVGEQPDVARLLSLLETPETASLAVASLGSLGYLDAVPHLIDLMSDDNLGVLATLAYRRITGAEDVERERPFPPLDVEEGDDEEEALPPDPMKARADWHSRQSDMNAQHRWHWGVGFPDDRPPALDRLRLDARRAVYLRLRSRFGSRLGDVELEGLASRQVREMATLSGGQ